MQKQIEQLRYLLEVENAEGILLESKAMKRYLGTLTGGGCAILITKDSQQLLFDGRYLVEAKMKEKNLTLYCIERGKKSLYTFVEEQMSAEGTLLIESEVSYQNYLLMKETGLNVKLAGDRLLGIRSIKTPEAIKKIEYVSSLTDTIFQRITTHIKAGMTERELCAFVYFECFSHGAEAMSFEPIVISGERTALPHGRASNKIICKNEPIMIDFGIEIEGYQSDMTRMISIGPPSKEILSIYQVVLQAQHAGIAAVQTGATGVSVDQASRKIIEDVGWGEYYVHGLGHGIGVDNSTEHPYLNSQSNDILAESMVMTCEPGVYIPNVGGVRIEDIVKIEKGKGVSITNTPKENMLVLEVEE